MIINPFKVADVVEGGYTAVLNDDDDPVLNDDNAPVLVEV